MSDKNFVSLDEAIKNGMLPQIEIFPNPYVNKEDKGIIRIVFPEFTCVCPKTGYPDFAAIWVWYLPDKYCIELKSWKLYLNAFRMIGAYHESVTYHIYSGLKELLKPLWLMVGGDFFPRGNVDTKIVFESSSERPTGADVLIAPFNIRARSFME